jgi:hypothetical protein
VKSFPSASSSEWLLIRDLDNSPALLDTHLDLEIQTEASISGALGGQEADIPVGTADWEH